MHERVYFTIDAEIGESELPDEVQVLPAGEVHPKGKTRFLVDGEACGLILDAFAESMTDLVIDYEHQSLSGAEAPAAGWIKELEDRGEDGVWAKVEWTERAKEYLANREYRYLSPVVLIRKSDGRAVELLGAALTNLPAIDGMTPVVNSGRDTIREEDEMAGEYKEMYLGVLKVMELPEDAGLAEVAAKVELMKSTEGFVPESDYLQVKETLRELTAETIIREALSCGKLTPSLIPWAREYAARDMDGFREFIGKAVPVVPLGGRGDMPREAMLDGPQRAVNRLLGIGDDMVARFILTEAA